MLAQLITFICMIGTFLLLAAALKLPAALATAGAATVGLAVSGNIGSLYHLIEGAFGYFDVILIIAMAMVFMAALEAAGILEEISYRITRRLGDKPLLLSLASMLLVMLPGMLTGSSTAAAMTTGRFVLPVLVGAGIAPARAGAFVALGSIIGMIAPPVNVPVMIIGSGIDMPYVGFDLPLLFLALPAAVAVSIWAAAGAKKDRPGKKPGAGAAPFVPASDVERISGIKVFIPILALVVMMFAVRLSNGSIPDPGIPFMFAVGALLAMVCGRRIKLWDTVVRGIGMAMPVMGVLVGAGMFVQVMTLTGVRGLLVTSALDIPRAWIFVAAAVALPVFGAISAYASSSVMGVPILLALLGNNEIVTAAALSMLASIGDLLPPIAIVPSLISQSSGEGTDYRSALLRQATVPILLLVLWAFAVLKWAPAIGKLL
ncbi:MAG: TRAP transporter large permease subunit [Firmicutes bacterium]|nr:TRAP transporter large permease subunit [Bacillota bacterium]